jgi:hypothetical protein
MSYSCAAWRQAFCEAHLAWCSIAATDNFLQEALMILRALALLTGVPLLLLGLLAVVTAIGMVGNPGPQGGPPPIAAQVIGVAIMAGIAVTGGALIWVGVRKRSKPVSAGTSQPSMGVTPPELVTSVSPLESDDGLATAAYVSPTVAAAPSSAGLATMPAPAATAGSFAYVPAPADYDEPSRGEFESMSLGDDDGGAFQIGTSGQLIGKCGPKMSGQLHYYFVAGVVVAVGVAVMIGLRVAPGAADPATAAAVGLWLGGALILFGGVIVALQLTRGPQTIVLYDDRLEEELGSKRRTVPLDHVAALHLQEFYEHRFAPQTFLVTVHVSGGRNLKFSTALGGDADLIVRCLADIAPDVEIREFVA